MNIPKVHFLGIVPPDDEEAEPEDEESHRPQSTRPAVALRLPSSKWGISGNFTTTVE